MKIRDVVLWIPRYLLSWLAAICQHRPMATLLLSIGCYSMAWDPQRFARTAFFFNQPQDVLQRLSPFPTSPATLDDGNLWSAKERVPRLIFGPLDDVVMGGVSESTFNTRDNVGIFSGTISTENNGGFAGCRSKALTPALNLSKSRCIKLRVRGDGQRYKFIVRDSYAWNGIAWAQSFDTLASQDRSGWQDIELPFSAFIPTLFAGRVPGAVLNTGQITAVQLTLSKFEYDKELNPAFSIGPFKLELESISIY